MAKKNKTDIDGYNERHLDQLIRRRMIQKDHGDENKYSRKDKHRKDNIHTDHEDDIPKDWKVLKVLGVLNSDWKEEWGGGFTWNGNGYYAPPGSFYVFDPLIPHAASDIFCDEKRIAIDFTLRALPEKNS